MVVLHWVQIPLHEPFRISNGAVAVKDSIVVEVQDGAFSGFDRALEDGDEVVFIPPVAGG